jgi:hypothetical protein
MLRQATAIRHLIGNGERSHQRAAVDRPAEACEQVRDREDGRENGRTGVALDRGLTIMGVYRIDREGAC